MHPVYRAGDKVALREFETSDVSALSEVYGDEEATRHMSFEPKSLEQIEAIVESAIESSLAEPRTEYMLALADVDTNGLVGVGRLALGEHQSGEIGFALRADLWGQGRGTECVKLLQCLGFRGLGLHRIWGARSPLNQASAKTMAAAGMIEEGTIRGHLYTRGAWRDSVVHSILSDEYVKIE